MNSKRVAIVQSNYIPWKGYFDLINMVDEFILFDDVQYTRRDWRNRNKIKTPNGPVWLSIPVQVKGKFEQRINETRVSDATWPAIHWKTIAQNYASAPYFRKYRDVFETLYLSTNETYLSEINCRFLRAICEVLGIRSRISWSSDYVITEGKTERLVSLCQQAGAAEYLSGPAARAYMDETLFTAAGINLLFMNYSGYPEYNQLYPPFEHSVSMIDLIFNEGPNAPVYMKSFAGR
jgi:hypothetical protein